MPLEQCSRNVLFLGRYNFSRSSIHVPSMEISFPKELIFEIDGQGYRQRKLKIKRSDLVPPFSGRMPYEHARVASPGETCFFEESTYFFVSFFDTLDEIAKKNFKKIE